MGEVFSVSIVPKRKLRLSFCLFYSFFFYITASCQFIYKSKTLFLQLITQKEIKLRGEMTPEVTR